MSFDDPFEVPLAPPQLELEDTGGDVLELIMSSPPWNINMAGELAHLIRNNVTLRSAFGYAMELNSQYNLDLRNANTIEEVKLAQGAMIALERYVTTLDTMMKEADKPKERPQ